MLVFNLTDQVRETIQQTLSSAPRAAPFVFFGVPQDAFAETEQARSSTCSSVATRAAEFASRLGRRRG